MNYGIIAVGIFSVFLWLIGVAQASLVKIGTASYKGSAYQLVWDNDNNGKSVIWLDYSNPGTGQTWEAQKSWATALDGDLSYNIDSAYSVVWESSWRLGDTVDGQYVSGLDGSTTAGFNITTSEMGHLFYVELGNTAYMEPTTVSSHPLQHAGIFEHLTGGWYWSGTAFGDSLNYAWWFGIYNGKQDISFKTSWAGGLAVRSGEVSVLNPVPEPATLILFGSGLAGLAAVRRRKKDC